MDGDVRPTNKLKKKMKKISIFVCTKFYKYRKWLSITDHLYKFIQNIGFDFGKKLCSKKYCIKKKNFKLDIRKL